MIDQKRENLLNLSLTATPSERQEVPELRTGYFTEDNTFEVIVRYQGDLSFLENDGIPVTYLLFQYAILLVPERRMDEITALPQIIYMEKPKLLFFADQSASRISCIQAVQEGIRGLSGDGVLMACVDSGIDYTHPDFRNEDGTTRIAALWDMSIPGNPPEGYRKGSFYSENEINRALRQENPEEQYRIVPSRDYTGHGTAVLGIAAGNGRMSGGVIRGIAARATLVVVKLGSVTPVDPPRTSELMQAVDFCVRFSLRAQRPLVLNLSFGNNYGSHEPYKEGKAESAPFSYRKRSTSLQIPKSSVPDSDLFPCPFLKLFIRTFYIMAAGYMMIGTCMVIDTRGFVIIA